MTDEARRRSLREALAGAPLFAGTPARELATLVAGGRIRRCPAGAFVYMHGDPSHEVFCLLEGRVQIVSTTNDGRKTLHAVVVPGAVFGELGVLSGSPRTTSAECLSDSEIWSLRDADFLDFLDRWPSASRALLSALANQVLAQESLVEDLLFLDLKGRVAKRLLALVSDSWERFPPDGTALPWDTTQTDLAHLSGGSREKVSRILNEFARRGFVRRDGHRYVLTDIRALRRLAGL